ncbi:MAG TPA: ABC transporter permease [Chitinispirillaceae bacterium]|nr:ABC transporter permease [Chitinispirillaceae bacterium]
MKSLMGLIVPAVLIVVWEILSAVGYFPPNWLPAPSIVFLNVIEMAKKGELAGHVGITVYRVFSGFSIGVAAATLLGSLTGCSRYFRQLVDPLLQALRNIPSMAWVPLFLLWLGIQEASKITLIAVGVFFPVYLNLMSGIRHLDEKLIEAGKMFGLKGVELVRRVVLPATLPSYITGLRSGLGLGWMFVVAAELMGASKGLGFLMNDGQMTGRPSIIIASIVLFAVCGKISDMIIEYTGRRFLKYRIEDA